MGNGPIGFSRSARLSGFSFFLIAPLFLASCDKPKQVPKTTASGAVKPVQSSSGSMSRLANGLQIEVLPQEKDDITRTLEIKTWRFNVTVPRRGQSLDASLEIRRGGATVTTVSSIGVGPISDDTEVVVSLHPLDDSWSDSDRFKSMLRIGANNGTGLTSNPFKNSGMASGNAEVMPDGSFLLMVGSRGKAARWPLEKDNDVALVLKLKPVTPAPVPKTAAPAARGAASAAGAKAPTKAGG
jgi:hypothetical protein